MSGVGVVLAGGCGMVAVVVAVTDLAAGRGAVGDTALASQFCIMLGVVGVVGAWGRCGVMVMWLLGFGGGVLMGCRGGVGLGGDGCNSRSKAVSGRRFAGRCGGGVVNAVGAWRDVGVVAGWLSSPCAVWTIRRGDDAGETGPVAAGAARSAAGAARSACSLSSRAVVRGGWPST